MKTIGILLGILFFAFPGMAQEKYEGKHGRFIKENMKRLDEHIDRIGRCKTQECLDGLYKLEPGLTDEQIRQLSPAYKQFFDREANGLKNRIDLRGHCKTKECLDSLSDGNQKLSDEEIKQIIQDAYKDLKHSREEIADLPFNRKKKCMNADGCLKGFQPKCSSSEMQNFTCRHHYGAGGFETIIACDADHAADRVDESFGDTKLRYTGPTTCDETDDGEYLDDGSAAGS